MILTVWFTLSDNLTVNYPPIIFINTDLINNKICEYGNKLSCYQILNIDLMGVRFHYDSSEISTKFFCGFDVIHQKMISHLI